MRKKFNLYQLIVVIVLLVFMMGSVAGCAKFFALPEESVPWDQMLPKDKAYMFNSSYNSIAADYKYQAAMPDLSDAQKGLLKAKWTVMKEVHPLIKTYSSIANTGGIPSPESEAEILKFLNQLGARLGKL